MPEASTPEERDADADAPHEKTDVTRGYGERTAPTDDGGLPSDAEQLEGHATQMPDSTGISPPRPRRPSTGGADDAPTDADD